MSRTVIEDTVTAPDRRAKYEAEGHWDSWTLPARVNQHVLGGRGNEPAVIDLGGSRTTTYMQLARDADRVAQYLLDAGVGSGDVVSVQMPNWYETVAIDLGALKIGAVLNPMLPLYRARELEHMLTMAETRIIFTPRLYRGFDHVGLIDAVRQKIGAHLDHVAIDDPESSSPQTSPWIHSLAEPTSTIAAPAGPVSELIFTSGTEAQPKAIMHTEQTTNFMVRAVQKALGITKEDVIWMPSPIGHSTGLNFGVRLALFHGLPLVLQDRWSGADAARLVDRYRCSYTLAATTFLADVVAEGKSGKHDLSSLRLFGSGGSSIPSALVLDAASVGINALRLYGSTELLIATWNRPESPHEKRIATDGPPIPFVEIDVRDEDGRSIRNEPGEIFGRSPGSCVGFYADPIRTAATFSPDGWIRSGDLGVLDDDGYVTIVGRKKEIIIRGGLNIAPREIEEMVMEFPEVERVAVVGLEHERLGEISCACVVLNEGMKLGLAEIVGRLTASGLATYKLPQALIHVDALPTTATGKVQKHELVASLDLARVESVDTTFVERR